MVGLMIGNSTVIILLQVRETQVFDLCTSEQIKRWNATVAPAHGAWLDQLDAEPAATGCLSVRRLRESENTASSSLNVSNPDPESAFNRTTQLAYFLSLEHAERAARREPTHKAMRTAYRDLFHGRAHNEGREEEVMAPPPVELWAGVYILESAGFDNLYVKCVLYFAS